MKSQNDEPSIFVSGSQDDYVRWMESKMDLESGFMKRKFVIRGNMNFGLRIVPGITELFRSAIRQGKQKAPAGTSSNALMKLDGLPSSDFKGVKGLLIQVYTTSPDATLYVDGRADRIRVTTLKSHGSVILAS